MSEERKPLTSDDRKPASSGVGCQVLGLIVVGGGILMICFGLAIKHELGLSCMLLGTAFMLAGPVLLVLGTILRVWK